MQKTYKVFVEVRSQTMSEDEVAAKIDRIMADSFINRYFAENGLDLVDVEVQTIGPSDSVNHDSVQ